MKKLIIIAIAIFGLGLSSVTAQTKFGHVDYVKVLDSLPTKLTADRDLQNFLTDGQKTIEEMNAVFEADYTRYMTEKDSLSSFLQEMKEKNLMEQQQLIQYKTETLQTDLEVFNKRLYEPLEKNLSLAVETIAKKHKLDYVLEVNSLLYFNKENGFNLTEEVKTELIRLEKIRVGS
jgi:Skp family chaperone for outer membrane proteins